MPDDHLLLTAEVILVPRNPAARGPVTSRNIQEHTPTPEVTSHASSEFQRLGFTTGTASGVGFSISAPRATFERVFHVKLEVSPTGAARVAGGAGREALNLPVTALPETVRGLVRGVGMQPPLDFGPTGEFR